MRGREPRAVAAGGALTLVYVLCIALTVAVAPGPVRPIFDGFAPPEPYRWISPPPDLAAGNRQPTGVDQALAVDPTVGSTGTNVTTSDGQALVNLRNGAIAPHPPDLEVVVQLVPVNPATLAPLPDDLEAQSNAYQVVMTYQPSGDPIEVLAMAGSIGLSAAAAADTMLYSPTGEDWEVLASRPYGGTHGQTSAMEQAGYYVTAAAPDHSGGGGGSTALIVILIGAVPIVAGAALYATRSRAQARSSKNRPNPSGARRRKPQGKNQGHKDRKR